MKNKKLIYGFALSLSLIFSLLYFVAFHFYTPSIAQEKSVQLYMNQIGLYKKEANAQQVANELETHSVKAYIYKNDDLYVVVSGVDTKEKKTNENGEQLKSLSYSYLLKKVSISDGDISSLIEKKDYEKALEMIGNQSKGNAG